MVSLDDHATVAIPIQDYRPDAEPWGELRLDGDPPAPKFPTHILPVPAARLVREIESAVGIDEGIPGLVVLVVCAGLIGSTASLRLGPKRFAHPSLFGCVIGTPGTGKTPAMGYVCEPLHQIDSELGSRFKEDRDRYHQAKAEYEAAKKGDRGKAPEKPTPVRVHVTDVTVEALLRRMAENPRGLIGMYDELKTLVGGLGQYKSGSKGNDLPHFLTIWSGGDVVIDRVSGTEFGEPLRVNHPHLSLIGNAQPSRLAELFRPNDRDGWVDRWLLVDPEPRPVLKSSERDEVSAEAAEDWEAIARSLWNRGQAIKGGSSHPHVVGFTVPGRSRFDAIVDILVEIRNDPDTTEAMKTALAKLEIYAARLALVLAVLRSHADPTSVDEPVVDEEIADATSELICYFRGMLNRVHARIDAVGLASAPEGVSSVLDFINRCPNRTFSETDLKSVRKGLREGDRLQNAVCWLQSRHAIRRVPDNPRPGKPGRKPSPRWEIHPDLFNSNQGGLG